MTQGELFSLLFRDIEGPGPAIGVHDGNDFTVAFLVVLYANHRADLRAVLELIDARLDHAELRLPGPAVPNTAERHLGTFLQDVGRTGQGWVAGGEEPGVFAHDQGHRLWSLADVDPYLDDAGLGVVALDHADEPGGIADPGRLLLCVNDPEVGQQESGCQRQVEEKDSGLHRKHLVRPLPHSYYLRDSLSRHVEPG